MPPFLFIAAGQMTIHRVGARFSIMLLTTMAGACSGPPQEATVSEAAGNDSAFVVGPAEPNSGPVHGALRTDAWDIALSSMRHVSLDSFPDVPIVIRRVAWAGQCAVPQPSGVDAPQNVVAGEFAARGQTDWAVLCTHGDSSGIFIEWGGPVQCPTPLAWSANRHFLQGSGPNEIEYSRAIGVASPEFILDRAREYSGPAPPSSDHSGVSDAFIGKASIVHYCHEGRWFRLAGSD